MRYARGARSAFFVFYWPKKTKGHIVWPKPTSAQSTRENSVMKYAKYSSLFGKSNGISVLVCWVKNVAKFPGVAA